VFAAAVIRAFSHERLNPAWSSPQSSDVGLAAVAANELIHAAWCESVIEPDVMRRPEWRLCEVLQPVAFITQRVEQRQRLRICYSNSQRKICSSHASNPSCNMRASPCNMMFSNGCCCPIQGQDK
jgi:hypothetical protein